VCINTSKRCIVSKNVIFGQDYFYKPFDAAETVLREDVIGKA
jgi:hypothetical protein